MILQASSVQLPQPQLAIGTVLDTSAVKPGDLKFYWRTIVRQALKRSQHTLYKLKRQGFIQDMVGKKMPEHNKAKIREILHCIQNAKSVEIAGFAPSYGQCVGRVGDEIDVTGVDGAYSGVQYLAYLLFRYQVDGRSKVYIHPEPVAFASGLRALPVANKNGIWHV